MVMEFGVPPEMFMNFLMNKALHLFMPLAIPLKFALARCATVSAPGDAFLRARARPLRGSCWALWATTKAGTKSHFVAICCNIRITRGLTEIP